MLFPKGGMQTERKDQGQPTIFKRYDLLHLLHLLEIDLYPLTTECGKMFKEKKL